MDYQQEIEGFESDSIEKLYAAQLVHSLQKEEIAVLALKLSDEYKTEEIATILGISVGTLWDIYRKAINALRGKINISL